MLQFGLPVLPEGRGRDLELCTVAQTKLRELAVCGKLRGMTEP